MSQRNRAGLFREMHTDHPLVLPNAWDAASARVLELAGARAIGTTSGGISWSLGRSDGQNLTREQMMRMVRYIVDAVDIPVNADVESGYGTGSLVDVARTIRAVVDAGAAGINIEDSPGRQGEALLPSEEHAERVHAARKAAEADGDLVINARVDTYILQVGAPETRFGETVKRANAYLAAGADCVFVPGVIDAETIGSLAVAIDGPLNVMAMPGAPPIKELAELGVARVSVGSAITQLTLGVTQHAARELLDRGTYESLQGGLSFAEANGLFSRRSHN